MAWLAHPHLAQLPTCDRATSRPQERVSNQSKDTETLSQGSLSACREPQLWAVPVSMAGSHQWVFFSPGIFLTAFQDPINPWYPQCPEQCISQFHFTLHWKHLPLLTLNPHLLVSLNASIVFYLVFFQFDDSNIKHSVLLMILQISLVLQPCHPFSILQGSNCPLSWSHPLLLTAVDPQLDALYICSSWSILPSYSLQ